MIGNLIVEWVAECFWPGVQETDLVALDDRAGRSAAAATTSGRPVRYLGSLLMREDEVVLCLFEGEGTAARQVALAAEVPFERILEAVQSPWGMRAGSGALPEGRGAR